MLAPNALGTPRRTFPYGDPSALALTRQCSDQLKTERLNIQFSKKWIGWRNLLHSDFFLSALHGDNGAKQSMNLLPHFCN
jgi:hypothetical protein